MTSAEERQQERDKFVALAMQAIDRRGEAVTVATLASETQTSRSRLDALFENDDALFAAIVEKWFEPDIAIMEEVVASDLPIRRKFYEFYARRFVRERDRYRANPELFALYCELGSDKFDHVEGFIDLADHYLSELIAQAQAEGFLEGLSINKALSLINQMVICYTSPQFMLMREPRLTEEKLAAIIDTIFAGLSAADGGARGVSGLHAVS